MASKPKWYVTSKGSNWIIVNEKTLRTKKIGAQGAKSRNYFDEAMAEAKRRNKDGKRPRYVA